MSKTTQLFYSIELLCSLIIHTSYYYCTLHWLMKIKASSSYTVTCLSPSPPSSPPRSLPTCCLYSSHTMLKLLCACPWAVSFWGTLFSSRSGLILMNPLLVAFTWVRKQPQEQRYPVPNFFCVFEEVERMANGFDTLFMNSGLKYRGKVFTKPLRYRQENTNSRL